jgi:hypothetical protein
MAAEPDVSAAERACPSGTTDAAAQGHDLPSWAQEGMAVCVPDSLDSAGTLSDLIVNKTEYAVDVSAIGGTLSWENGQGSDIVTQVADLTLSLSSGVTGFTEVILPPDEEAVLTPTKLGTYINFHIGFDAVAYNTAEIVTDYLLDEGMENSDAKAPSVISDIKECAQAVNATTEGNVYESLPLAAKIANLETRVVKCGSVLPELKEAFGLDEDSSSEEVGDSTKEPSSIGAAENFAIDVLDGLHPDGE